VVEADSGRADQNRILPAFIERDQGPTV
jgi:hypothetical protein